VLSIRPARPSDREQLAAMRAELWPDASPGEHARELDRIFAGTWSPAYPYAIFVAETSTNALTGFAEVTLRSYADGCESGLPVAYLEGWFVDRAWRRRGIGARLVGAAEEWGRAQGCVEMASDTWLDNEVSQHAHTTLGFELVDRVVTYRKSIAEAPSRVRVTAAAAASWADRYFKAWKTNDAALVGTLFTEDARYFYGPFRPPAKGREEIVRRWTANAQQHVETSHEVVAVAEDRAVIHWHAAFDEPAGRAELDGILVVTFALDGRCREHREWWVERRIEN
jgi:aminoglycoside 6'-N-acetyltransferase I